MCQHEPPVHIEFTDDIKDGMDFNSSLYKAYTRKGKYYDFVVWPALYLCKNGSILSKGVAQGKNR